jgi:hypothetical protein
VSAVAGEEEGSAVGQTTADRIPRDRPLGVIHSGGRYLYGFGPSSYGIWDAANEGPPAEEFPATKQGRLEGWRRYVELEPAAQNIPPEQSPVREEREEVELRSRRGGILVGGGIALVLIIGLVAFLLTRSGGGGAAGPGDETVTGPKTTHIDVSGGATLSEDLTKKSFSPPGTGLIGQYVRAKWEGAQTQLTLSFDGPAPGDYPTSQLPRVHELDISFPAADGSKVQLRSVNAECVIKIVNASSKVISGNFECLGYTPSGADLPVDIKGTFFAGA